MKHLVCVFALLVAVTCPVFADVTLVQFTARAGSAISFDGASNFSFTGPGFQVTSSSPSNGLATLDGSISGTYTIGAVTIVGPVQTAPVTGSGTFTILDALAVPFTADVQWVNIQTLGTGGTANSVGSVNLTNFAYAGSNTDLQDLATHNKGIVVATFQFIPAKTLTTLKTTSDSTSYSGTLQTVPDGGATLMLLGGALFGIETLRRKLRR